MRNFGGNVEFTPQHIFAPESEEEVLRLLAEHRGRRVRVVGRLHSWSQAPVGDDVVLDLRRLNTVRVEQRDGEPWAVIGAGCQIKRALDVLDRQGLTLPTVGLVTEQTIAGAAATATHGSGRHSISHYVEEVRIARYDSATGEPVIETITSGPELQAVRCALGRLGVVLSVAVRCRPQYLVEEHFRTYESLSEAIAHEEQYPLQLFYLVPWAWRFLVQHRTVAKGPRSRLAWLYQFYWFAGIDLGLHLPLLLIVRVLRRRRSMRLYYRHVVPRTVLQGWRVMDKSQTILTMKHERFRHVEIEVFVRRSRLEEAVAYAQRLLEHADGDERALSDDDWRALEDHSLAAAVRAARGTYTHHYPICIRKVLADDALISMAEGGGETHYAISFITYSRPKRRAGFFKFADVLARTMAARFDARPHWGKVCPLGAEEIARLYPRLEEFQRECLARDPHGAFGNAWTDALLFPTMTTSGGGSLEQTPASRSPERDSPDG